MVGIRDGEHNNPFGKSSQHEEKQRFEAPIILMLLSLLLKTMSAVRCCHCYDGHEINQLLFVVVCCLLFVVYI